MINEKNHLSSFSFAFAFWLASCWCVVGTCFFMCITSCVSPLLLFPLCTVLSLPLNNDGTDKYFSYADTGRPWDFINSKQNKYSNYAKVKKLFFLLQKLTVGGQMSLCGFEPSISLYLEFPTSFRFQLWIWVGQMKGNYERHFLRISWYAKECLHQNDIFTQLSIFQTGNNTSFTKYLQNAVKSCTL